MIWEGMYEDKYAVRRLRKSIELLDAKPGCAVLDVGCFTQEARKYLRGCEYVGIDNIDLCIDTVVRDLDYGFSFPMSFDRILCLETLEHLKYPHLCLSAIYEHLTKEGLAVISLPNEVTIFHRFRALFGTLDAEAFSPMGKHLHLPSITQSREFLENKFAIVGKHYYINPGAKGSRQSRLGTILRLIPDWVWQLLADLAPGLFARGTIFVLRKK